tara:strand:- start:1404 stop:2015 length:612 start_codon:yes stop_codon:yes gene_type:complete
MLFVKIKWISGLLVVFLLILTTNLLDRQHFQTIKNSVVSIYEDRLTASDLIFKLSEEIEKKNLALVTSDSNFFDLENKTSNQTIDLLIDKYFETVLTQDEEREIEMFHSDFKELKKLESSELNSLDYPVNSSSNKLLLKIRGLKNNLSNLSKIQLSEGEKQLSIASKSVSAVVLFTRIEIVFLVIIGLFIQAIILYNPKRSRS